MKIILILPVYNEEFGLTPLLDSFQNVLKRGNFQSTLVIVDDGSTDGSADVIKGWSSKVQIEFIRHAENRGLGETMRIALHKATEIAQSQDIIVAMDADNTHDPELIPRMIESITAGNDIIIASRYRAGSQVIGLGIFRRLMCYGARVLFQLVFRLEGVRDYTCGFRAYRPSVLCAASSEFGNAFISENSFACQAEILVKTSVLHPKIAEIPMILHYDKKLGRSKMGLTATTLATLRLLFDSRIIKNWKLPSQVRKKS